MSAVVHIVGAFETAIRGSERAAFAAARLIAALAPVELWSTVPLASALLRLADEQGLAPRVIRPFAGVMPRGGRLIIWGTHFDIGIWLRASAPSAVAIVSELFHHAALYRAILDVRAAGLEAPRLVHVSTLVRDSALLDGEVLYPPADLAPMLAIGKRAGRVFTVGRVSRDIAAKHHADDPALYASLVAAGYHVRILGGSCLSGSVPASPLLELLPQGSVEVAEFLASLDVFFYRTGGEGLFVEPSGVAVLEASAAGLPVVAGRPGGYLDLITDGINGFVIDGNDEALVAIRRLAGDRQLRLAMGDRARSRVRDYFGPDYARRLLEAAFGGDTL